MSSDILSTLGCTAFLTAMILIARWLWTLADEPSDWEHTRFEERGDE